MGKQLIAKEEYSLPNRNLYFKRGEIFAPSDELYLFLMADAPGVFEHVEDAEPKAIDEPIANKMVRRPKVKK